MSVHFSHSVVSKFCDPMHWITPGFSVHYKLPKLESVITSNHLILCHPLLLLPSIFPSIRVFCNESVLCNRWPKYWSFRFSISPSNEYSGLISFRMDKLDLLAAQQTLKSLLQHHSSKASIVQLSAFFIAQMRAYREQCQMHDLQSRRLSFETRDQAWFLKSFFVTQFY